MKLRKKLIEVALPLEAINKASAREKSIRHGHPSTLHLWWARRPLAAARAVIFSQMVDDPSEYVDTLKMDDKLRKKAEKVLKDRHPVWVTATEVKRKADEAGIDSPDPGPEPTLDDIIAEQERDRLFKIIEELVLWENTTNETVLDKARAEIWQSWRRTCADNADHPRAKELFDRNKLPAFHDPFAGGGALPLEAQRLGLEAYASDLNPVAVLINKAMIEIPPKFAGMPPVNPEWQSRSDTEKALKVWKGAEGLAEDVRYYGRWMRDEAEKRIGHLYPKVEITEEVAKDRPDLKKYIGKKLTVIAWIWARTVKSPNPAFRDIDVPLASSFMLSKKVGKETFVQPVVDGKDYRFEVKVGGAEKSELAKYGTKNGSSGTSFFCLVSRTPMPFEYLRSQGKQGQMGARLMAVALEGESGRVYISPTSDIEALARVAVPQNVPDTDLPEKALGFRVQEYGMKRWRDLFTPRQLLALSTFSDLISEVRERIANDRKKVVDRGEREHAEHDAARPSLTYANAIAVYLAFNLDRLMMQFSTLSVWSSNPAHELVVNMFSRQTLSMTWDFGEVNPFCEAASWHKCLDFIVKTIQNFGDHFGKATGHTHRLDAQSQNLSDGKVVSTDPPYYDNIGYADLSDFFYIWLRRSLKPVFADLFSTLTVPKVEELIATPFRHASKAKAEQFFLEGMTMAMNRLSSAAHPAFPVTIYYAFKQAETETGGGTASTGWETFLDAVIRAEFAVSGTWPVRTERPTGVKTGVNVLASSIVLVCRKRIVDATTVTRREFVNALKSELPDALRHLQRGNIAPVDLAQAAIGPGMAVYTRYEKILDAEGKPLSVRDALALINQTLDEVLAEQEGDFDADTRWALAWFEEFGFEAGEYGRAETLSKAKNTSIAEMADPRTSPILEAKAGKVRLFRPDELQENWTPESDGRLTVWDMVHQLVRVLEKDGESAAARIAAQLGARAETARELCYRLYTLCERKKRAAEALSYNGLVQSWPEIMRLSQEQASAPTATQGEMFD